MTLPALIDRFADLKVLVVGDVMLDVYLGGSSGRLCREAPVPVVDVEETGYAPGGAGNTAVNVAALGANVRLLGVVGADLEGERLRGVLADEGVSVTQVVAARNRSTRTAHRIVADSQILLRFDQGGREPLEARTETRICRVLPRLFAAADAVIVSDYDHGLLTPRVLEQLAELQAAHRRVLVVDAKRPAAYRKVRPTAVKPNYEEVAALLGLERDGDRVAQVAEHGERILQLTGARAAAVTLDGDGTLVLERRRHPYRTYARPVRHPRPTGAGDTFTACLALAFAAGADTPAAAELASAAAGVVVEKDGTATCHREELRARVTADEKYVTEARRLAGRLQLYRHQGKRIVFTNGCFDLLHRGHITYLNQAKSRGDVLIVGLNSDESVQRLKGTGRPINSLEDRAQVLAALSCVDHIVAFSADTASELVSELHPDVFVKGGDYTRDTIPEAQVVERLGGVVEVLPYVPGESTTGIIERILDVSAPLAEVEIPDLASDA